MWRRVNAEADWAEASAFAADAHVATVEREATVNAARKHHQTGTSLCQADACSIPRRPSAQRVLRDPQPIRRRRRSGDARCAGRADPRVCLAVRLGRRAPRLGRDVRVEMAGYLLSCVAFACTASSSLTYQTWWTILASACAVWWAALPRRTPAPGAQETGGPSSVVDRPHVAGSGVGARAARTPVGDQALHSLQ